MDVKKLPEVKFWLKRVEPIEYYEEDGHSRVEFVYIVTNPSKQWMSLETSVQPNEDPVNVFGKLLAKMYKYNEDIGIVVFYKNYKLLYNKERLIRSIKMYESR